MKSYEYVYDSVGNIILIIELIYYTIAICYYVWQFIKGRHVQVKKWRYEQHTRRRVHWKRGQPMEVSYEFVDPESRADGFAGVHGP